MFIYIFIEYKFSIVFSQQVFHTCRQKYSDDQRGCINMNRINMSLHVHKSRKVKFIDFKERCRIKTQRGFFFTIYSLACVYIHITENIYVTNKSLDLFETYRITEDRR